MQNHNLFKALAVLSSIILTGAILEAKHKKHHDHHDSSSSSSSSSRHSHSSHSHSEHHMHPHSRSENIGYLPGQSPVALTPQALIMQLVTGQTTTIYAGSAVEPTVAVNPQNEKQIVAAWQQGRISNGGALEIAIAFTLNGGQDWNRTTIPLQITSGGLAQRVSNVWLSYSQTGDKVYLTAETINATQDPNTNNQNNIIASYSSDNGQTWSNPSYLFASENYIDEPTGDFAFAEKGSITADPNLNQFAYVIYNVFNPYNSFHGTTYFNRTEDGGLTWSPNRMIYDPFPDLVAQDLTNPTLPTSNETISNVIVVQPVDSHGTTNLKKHGDLINLASRRYALPTATATQYTNDFFPYQYSAFDIVVFRSQNQGSTWDTSSTIVASLTQDPVVYTGGYSGGAGVGTLCRTGDLDPSIAVNPKNGNLYVAYQTTEFNGLPQIGLKISYDGGYTWSASARVSTTPLSTPNPQAFTPFVAVLDNGYVGVLYSDFRNDPTSNSIETPTDTWVSLYKETGNSSGGSTNIGLNFVKDVRLSANSYIMQNGPTTTKGVMTNGDYSFLVGACGSFYALYTQSHFGPFAPTLTIYNDPITSTVLLLDNNYRNSPYFRIINTGN